MTTLADETVVPTTAGAGNAGILDQVAALTWVRHPFSARWATSSVVERAENGEGGATG